MKTIEQFLASLPDEVWFVPPDATVQEALQMMVDHDIGAVLVMDQGRRLIGIVSERDFVRNVLVGGADPREVRVEEIMTNAVCYVTPEQTLDDCLAIMVAHRIRHLPVIHRGALLGMVTIRDLIKELIDAQVLPEQKTPACFLRRGEPG